MTWVMSTRGAGALALAVIGIAIGAGCGGDGASQSEKDQAIAQAQEAYDRAKLSGKDLEAGPCLAESLTGLSDWVVDVAHDPRQDVDDDPANQCQRYRDGEASHFVELSPVGRVIRAE
jgi:hypothetical protein